MQLTTSGLNAQNPYGGVSLFAEAAASVSYMWEAESVYTLEEETAVNFGGSVGAGTSYGGDIIFTPEADLPVGGFSATVGKGIGIDMHTYKAETVNLVTYNYITNEWNTSGAKKVWNKITNNTQTKKHKQRKHKEKINLDFANIVGNQLEVSLRSVVVVGCSIWGD